MAASLIEIGWVIAGALEEPDREAVDRARGDVLDYLREVLPAYSWSMPLVMRAEMVREARVEPVVLLEEGLSERNLGHWDFAIVLTDAELMGRERRSAVAVISRALESAVVSTSLVDPRARNADTPRQERVEVIARWVESLVLHFLGHFAGLPDRGEDTCMRPPSESNPPSGARFDQVELALLDRQLAEVADPRLEESDSFRTAHPVVFYLAAIKRNGRELLSAILEAEPWRMPVRLSKLFLAAISTLFILCMTEETWTVASTQTPLHALGLSLVSIVGPVAHVLIRERLLVRRRSSGRTEQEVVTNVTTACVVLLGMTTTFVALFVVAFGLAHALFSAQVVQRWTEGGASGLPGTVLLAVTVASLGLVIGALGVSLEEEYEFRHTIFVDEEL